MFRHKCLIDDGIFVDSGLYLAIVNKNTIHLKMQQELQLQAHRIKNQFQELTRNDSHQEHPQINIRQVHDDSSNGDKNAYDQVKSSFGEGSIKEAELGNTVESLTEKKHRFHLGELQIVNKNKSSGDLQQGLVDALQQHMKRSSRPDTVAIDKPVQETPYKQYLEEPPSPLSPRQKELFKQAQDSDKLDISSEEKARVDSNFRQQIKKEIQQLIEQRAYLSKIVHHKTAQIMLLKKQMISQEIELRSTYSQKLLHLEKVAEDSRLSNPLNGNDNSSINQKLQTDSYLLDQCQKLKTELAIKQIEITTLKGEREKLAKLMGQKIKQVNILKKELIQQQEELLSCYGQKWDAQEQISMNEAKNKAEIQQLVNKNESLINKLHEMGHSLDEKQEKMKKWQEELEELDRKVHSKGLGRDLNLLKLESKPDGEFIQDQRKTIGQDKQKIELLQQNQSLEQQKQFLCDKLGKITAELSQKNKILRQWMQEVAYVQKQAKRLQAHKEELLHALKTQQKSYQQQLVDKDNQIQAIYKDLQLLKDVQQSLQNENSLLSKKIKQLKGQVTLSNPQSNT